MMAGTIIRGGTLRYVETLDCVRDGVRGLTRRLSLLGRLSNQMDHRHLYLPILHHLLYRRIHARKGSVTEGPRSASISQGTSAFVSVVPGSKTTSFSFLTRATPFMFTLCAWRYDHYQEATTRLWPRGYLCTTHAKLPLCLSFCGTMLSDTRISQPEANPVRIVACSPSPTLPSRQRTPEPILLLPSPKRTAAAVRLLCSAK